MFVTLWIRKLPVSCLPHPSSREPNPVVTYADDVFQKYKTICFTDGSKLVGKVGLAFVVYEDGMETVTIQHRLLDECSVFQVKLLCLNLAAKWIRDSSRDNGRLKYFICTDSLSSLFPLRNTVSTEKLVVEIHCILYALENVVEIHFSYVRGHSSNLGNERADQLLLEACC